jgi:hypothetical protein
MKEPGKTLEDLVVWQKSYRPVLAVYRLTQAFPYSKTGCHSLRSRLALRLDEMRGFGFID